MKVSVDTNDPRWQLMERVSNSPIMEKSTWLRAFLRYVCEMELTGRRPEINEQQIGVGVFGRSPAYSPGEDSIVRSQARLLRQRLEEYFRTTGRLESVRLTIPKGSYVRCSRRILRSLRKRLGLIGRLSPRRSPASSLIASPGV